MIKKRFVKLVFVTILTTGFVMMTLRTLKTKKKASSDLRKYSRYFAENAESKSRNFDTAIDLKSDVLKVKFPRLKSSPISLQKPSTCAKGGYDVRIHSYNIINL